MHSFRVGDLVARKSYGEDIYFTVAEVVNRHRRSPLYILKGVIHRLIADATATDLVGLSEETVEKEKERFLRSAVKHPVRSRFLSFFNLFPRTGIPGTVLHLDGDESFLRMCLRQYDDARIKSYGKAVPESEQPYVVRELLKKHRPNILVVTGHDSIKKKNPQKDSVENYTNSRYFIQCVQAAREYEADPNKLCVFAGACQSYYEKIISEGANFGSSPGRILINALDPSIVAEKIAVTDTRTTVTPQEIGRLVESGSKGVSGINTKGQMVWR